MVFMHINGIWMDYFHGQHLLHHATPRRQALQLLFVPWNLGMPPEAWGWWNKAGLIYKKAMAGWDIYELYIYIWYNYGILDITMVYNVYNYGCIEMIVV